MYVSIMYIHVLIFMTAPSSIVLPMYVYVYIYVYTFICICIYV